MNIPLDVRITTSNKTNNKIIIWVISTLVVGIIILLFGEEALHEAHKSVRIALYILLLTLPAIVTKIPLVLFDRSWKGTIERVYSETGAEYEDPVAGKMTIRTATIYIVIKLTNGRIVEREVYHGPVKNENYIERYSVGDTVIHVKGAKHLQIVSGSRATATCVICGAENSVRNHECEKCEHTLLIK